MHGPVRGVLTSVSDAAPAVLLAAVSAIVLTITMPTTAIAQEPAASPLASIAARLRAGQSIWVTDSAGREVHGRFEGVENGALTLRARERHRFTDTDVRRVRARDPDSLKNGTLAGMVVGAGLGTAWCIGAIADDSGDIDARVECAEGFTVFPGLGALIGLAVDGLIPGRIRTIYPMAQARPHVTLVPIVTGHAKGAALAVAF